MLQLDTPEGSEVEVMDLATGKLSAGQANDAIHETCCCRAALRARIEAEARNGFPARMLRLDRRHARRARTALAIALHPARNIATRADRFEIAPEDHFAALKTARGEWPST